MSAKVTTSVTLSKDLLDTIDSFKERFGDRSELIETALHTFIDQFARSKQAVDDLEIINQHADNLNKEAMDVLEYQVRL